MDVTLYDALGGHERDRVGSPPRGMPSCLADVVMSHPFSHGGDPHHIERLAAYWSEQLGGPPLYTTDLGDESFVVRMHAGNGEHAEMDRACGRVLRAGTG